MLDVFSGSFFTVIVRSRSDCSLIIGETVISIPRLGSIFGQGWTVHALNKLSTP